MRFKQVIATLALAFGLSLSFTPGAYAAVNLFGQSCAGVKNSSLCDGSKSTTNPLYGSDGILVKVANIIFFVIGVAAAFVMIISGIRYILANGDSGKISQAKDGIIYSLVGLVIAVLGESIIVLVVSRL